MVTNKLKNTLNQIISISSIVVLIATGMLTNSIMVSETRALASTNNTQVDNTTVVVFGDSFSSGTGTSDATGTCQRSNKFGYANYLDAGTIYNYACAGAVIGSMDFVSTSTSLTNSIQQSLLENTLIKQLFQFESDVENDIITEAPTAIYLTIGGNDIGFVDIINHCLKDINSVFSFNGCTTPESSGYETYQRAMNLVNPNNDEMFKSSLLIVFQILTTIIDEKFPNAPFHIVILPYVPILPQSGSCKQSDLFSTDSLKNIPPSANLEYDNDTVQALNLLQQYLNQAIERAVTVFNSTALPNNEDTPLNAIIFAGQVASIFSEQVVPNNPENHDMCQIKGMNFINKLSFTLVPPSVKPTSAHPNDMGYRTIGIALRRLAGLPKIARPVPMHRIYNPNSGEHHYTVVYAEKDHAVESGWNYEGIAWVAPSFGDEVERLYNPNAGDHHYTLRSNIEEIKHALLSGWSDEKVGWHSGGAITIYRLYNPNATTGTHHYTRNIDEYNYLKSVGWNGEDIAFNALY